MFLFLCYRSCRLVFGLFSRRDLRCFVLSGSRVLPCVNYSIKILVPRVVLFDFFVIVFIPNRLPQKINK